MDVLDLLASRPVSFLADYDRTARDPGYRERWFADLARTVAVDFDGVLHPYTEGWVGPEPADEPPMPGALEFLTVLAGDGYRVVVHSTRCDTPDGRDATRRWLHRYGLDVLVHDVTCQKPAAVAYVDDRAVSYRDGNWAECLREVDRLAEGRAHGAAPSPRAAEVLTCGFCGYEAADPEWITRREGDEYGAGPGKEDQLLCGFCRWSYMASNWLAGGSEWSTRDMEVLMLANVQRAESRRGFAR